jgi:hypothetical protein
MYIHMYILMYIHMYIQGHGHLFMYIESHYHIGVILTCDSGVTFPCIVDVHGFNLVFHKKKCFNESNAKKNISEKW